MIAHDLGPIRQAQAQVGSLARHLASVHSLSALIALLEPIDRALLGMADQINAGRAEPAEGVKS